MKLKLENFKKRFDDFCLKIFIYLRINKRKFFAISIFVVLFLVLILPANETKSASPLWLLAGPAGLGAYLGSWLWENKDATATEIIASLADSVLSVTIFPLVYFAFTILLDLFGIGVTFAAWLVDVFINPNIYSSVFNSQTIRIGWETVRDVSNTFFVMILLLIAFATILRIQTYSAKNLLPKFIIAIFLINFSAEITKIVIDIGQIFMFEIRNWMGGFGGSTGWGGSAGTLTSIVGQFRDKYLLYGFLPNTITPGGKEVMGIIFAVAFTAVLMFVYLLLSIFLLLRLVYLAVMIVLSPLAFLGIVLPGLNKYTGDFWNKLFSNSISGFVLLFFVYLATQMANELVQNPPAIPAATGRELNLLQYSITYVVPYSVSIVMLLFSVSAAQKLGAYGAGSVVGGIGGIGKIAIGTWGGIKLAGGLGKAVGAPVARRIPVGGTSLSDWASQKYRGAKDKIAKSPIARATGVTNWIYKGNYSAFKKNRGEVEEKKNYYKRASTKGRYDEMLNGGWKGKSNNDIAAVVESMIEKKELTKDKIRETFTDTNGKVDEGKVKNLTDNIDEALLRAKSSFDVPKLRESMPRYAAMIELGKTGKESDEDKKAVDKKTEEYVKENVSEGKLRELDRSAKEDPVIMNTIRKDHDDFSGWVQGQSTTDQQSIYRGLEGILTDADKKIRDNNLGDGIHNMTGSDENTKKATGMEKDEINKIRRIMARNNNNGHVFLNNPVRQGMLLDLDKQLKDNELGDVNNIKGSDNNKEEEEINKAIKEKTGKTKPELQAMIKNIKESMKRNGTTMQGLESNKEKREQIVMDDKGRVDFEHGDANETMRKDFVDSVMKERNDYKGRSDEFYENLAPHFRQKHFENVGKWESVRHQRIAKEAYFKAHPEQYDPESEHGKIVEYLNADTVYSSIKTEAPSPVRNEKLVEDREHKKKVEEIESKSSDEKEKEKKLKKESERHNAELERIKKGAKRRTESQQPQATQQETQTSTPPQQAEREEEIDRKYDEKLNSAKSQKENQIAGAEKEYSEYEAKIKLERKYLNAGSASPTTKEEGNREYDEKLKGLRTETESQKEEANRKYDEEEKRINQERAEAKAKAKPEAKAKTKTEFQSEKAETEKTEPRKTEPAETEEQKGREGDGEIVEKLDEIKNEISLLKNLPAGEKEGKAKSLFERLCNVTNEHDNATSEEHYPDISKIGIELRKEISGEKGESDNQTVGEELERINRETKSLDSPEMNDGEKKKLADELKEAFEKLTDDYIDIVEFPGFDRIKESLEDASNNIDSQIAEKQKAKKEQEENERWDDEYNQ